MFRGRSKRMKKDDLNKLQRKVFKMDLGNPIITTLVGLVVFYIGLKMFSGGMKSMGNIDHLSWFIANPYYCLLYTSPSPRDKRQSRMPSSA